MKAFIVLAAALLLSQEKNEAEELFRKMEEKFVQAKTLQVNAKATLDEGKIDSTAQLMVGEGNRARIAVEMKFMGSTRSFSSVSDGKSIQLTSAEGTRLPAYPTPESFGQLMRKSVAICGVYIGSGCFSGGQAGTDPATAYRLSSFVMGPKGKIGDIETQAVQYKAAPKLGEELTVIIWIDPKTQLPLKRSVVGKERSMEETYTEIKLDEKIDAAKFELPKDK